MNQQKRIGQRYQVNERVLKKTISASRSMAPRKGKILSVEKRLNKLGHVSYYYRIQWDDLKSPALHAQHVLSSLA